MSLKAKMRWRRDLLTGNDQKHDRKQQKPKGNKAKKADNEIKKGSCHGSGV